MSSGFNRSDCPAGSTWDLDSIYPLLERQYNRLEVERAIANLTDFAGRDSPTDDEITAVIETIPPTWVALEDLQTFGILRHSVDTENLGILDLLKRNADLTTRWITALKLALASLRRVDAARLERLSAGRNVFDQPALEEDRETVVQTEYTARLAVAAQMEIARRASIAGSQVPLPQRDMVIERALRGLFGGNQGRFVTALQNQADLEIARARRGGTSFRDFPAKNSGVPMTFFSRWTTALRGNLSILHRFLAWNCKYFGHPAVPLKHLIMEARLIEAPLPFHQAFEEVVASATILGADYVAALTKLRDERRIDWCLNQGRRQGSGTSLLRGQPVVLINLEGTYQGRRTIAHELAHGAQANLSTLPPRDKVGAENSRLAHEVIAAVGEFLPFRMRFRALPDGEEKFFLVLCEAWRCVLEVFMCSLWGEFELAAYEHVESGHSLDSSWLCGLAAQLLTEYCGQGVIVDQDTAGVIWPFDHTLFTAPQTRWIYPPAKAFGWHIINNILHGGEPATQRYLNFVREANSQPAAQTLSSVGVDLNLDASFQLAFQHLKWLMDKLEQYPYRLA